MLRYLNLTELETVRVSRNPSTIITANGEVQTNVEARVYVHDLELFVTVQILEDTPAVLSLGKLYEEHGYSFEWASGQKPLLTKSRKTILPGLATGSSSSSSSSSFTSLPQETSGDIPSSPATQRSDDTNVQASRNRSRNPTKTKNKIEDNIKVSRNQLRDLPDW